MVELWPSFLPVSMNRAESSLKLNNPVKKGSERLQTKSEKREACSFLRLWRVSA